MKMVGAGEFELTSEAERFMAAAKPAQALDLLTFYRKVLRSHADVTRSNVALKRAGKVVWKYSPPIVLGPDDVLITLDDLV